MARSQIGETLQRVRRQLLAGRRVELAALNTTMTSGVTSVVLDVAASNFAGLRRGSLVSIDLETMRLTADPSGSTLTVSRGFMDSDPVAHTAGAEVWIDPEFHPIDIHEAMLAEILSWGPDLYRVVDTELTVAAGDAVAELPATMSLMYGVIDARRNSTTGITDASWETWPRANIRVQRGTAATFGDFTTSGQIIRFLDEMYDGLVYVLAAVPFNTSSFATTNDLKDDCGLKESMLDVLEMGVKLRLNYDRDLANLSQLAQSEPRRSEETPPGAGLTTGQFGFAVYNRRKAEEIAKLRSTFPIQFA